MDLDGWLARARERFLEAYRDGLREARVWIDTDPALLRAFEIDQELYEFTYATRYMPSWLYAATEGMTALFAEPRVTADRVELAHRGHRGVAGGPRAACSTAGTAPRSAALGRCRSASRASAAPATRRWSRPRACGRGGSRRGSTIRTTLRRGPTGPSSRDLGERRHGRGGRPPAGSTGRGRVIAVTNDPDSPLAANADVVLALLAGDEVSGIATRTYRATVATLGLLAGGMTGAGPSVDDLRPVVDALGAAIASRDEWLLEAADRLDGAPAIDVVSGAAELGIAEQAALMLREARD